MDGKVYLDETYVGGQDDKPLGRNAGAGHSGCRGAAGKGFP